MASEHIAFLYTETSLHAGTGSSVSAIDLPIQRERATGYPLVQGSGVKGALRNQAELDKTLCISVFGPETKNAADHAGAISVGDARIVLFPVRSLSGVFAYATSVFSLARLRRLRPDLPALAAEPASGAALINTASKLTAARGSIVLEEFAFSGQPSAEVDEVAGWLSRNALPQTEEYAYWRTKLTNSLIVLPENDFCDFVVSSTEITTHVRLTQPKKTVADGALWTKESIPSDALFVVPVTVRAARDASGLSADAVWTALQGAYPASRIQLGGDETTGQGVVALRWLQAEG